MLNDRWYTENANATMPKPPNQHYFHDEKEKASGNTNPSVMHVTAH